MRRFRFTAIIAVAFAGGCSLVNSIDDVKPADDGTYSGVPRPDASVQIDEAGGGPTTTDSGADGSIPTSTEPVMVVGGEADVGDASERAPVLTVLDPTTGQEIATREAMWIAGIGHDPARDLWYLFEAPSYFIAGPNDAVNLHIRSFNPAVGWTELAVLKGIPPITYYDAIGVTTERISYVAQPAPSTTQPRLVTIDTSNPSAPLQIDATMLTAMPRGVIATRSTTGPGGNLTLVNIGSASDPGGSCEVYDGGAISNYTVCTTTLRRWQIPNSGSPRLLETDSVAPGAVISSAQPAYASVICGGAPDDLVVLPNGGFDAGQEGVYTFNYNGTQVTDSVQYTMSTAVATPSILRRAAVNNSRRLVFVVETNSDTNLYSIALDPPQTIVKESLRHSGQSVYYEPASDTVFAPFNQGEGYTFSPFKVSGTNSLQERVSGSTGDWNPPVDLRPFILGIKDPPSENCGP